MKKFLRFLAPSSASDSTLGKINMKSTLQGTAPIARLIARPIPRPLARSLDRFTHSFSSLTLIARLAALISSLARAFTRLGAHGKDVYELHAWLSCSFYPMWTRPKRVYQMWTRPKRELWFLPLLFLFHMFHLYRSKSEERRSQSKW